MNMLETDEKKIESLTKEIETFSKEIEGIEKIQMDIIRLKIQLKQKSQWMDSTAESRGQRHK